MKKDQKYFVKKRRLVKTKTFLVALLTVAILVFSCIVSAIDYSGNQKMLNNNKITISIGAAKANRGNFIKDAKLSVISSSEKGREQKFYAVDCSSYEFIWFDPLNPGVYNYIGPWPNTQFPQGATFVEDVEWVCDTVGNIWTVEEDTGVYTYVGSSGTGELVGLAYHEVSGKLYGISTTNLFEISMVDGSATPIGLSLGIAPDLMISLDCDKAGDMYGYAIDSNLDEGGFYSIDLGFGTATLIDTTGVVFNYGQDMAYDYNNEIMYACVYNYETYQGELHKVNLITGQFEYQATLHDGHQTTCFAIPYGFSVDTGGPYEGCTDEDITFTGSASGGTSPYTYEWDFESDGTYDATGNPVTHSYSSKGIYTVTLRVTDSSSPPLIGSATTTATVDCCIDIGDPYVVLTTFGADKVKAVITNNRANPISNVNWDMTFVITDGGTLTKPSPLSKSGTIATVSPIPPSGTAIIPPNWPFWVWTGQVAGQAQFDLTVGVEYGGCRTEKTVSGCVGLHIFP